MNQRDTYPAVAVPGASRGGYPRPQLSPVSASWHRIRPERRSLLSSDAGGIVALGNGRWFLPPGVYRFSGGIVIEQTELTDEQLRQLIRPAEAREDAPDISEEEARREAARVRAAQLVEAYRAKLGEGPPGLPAAMGAWLGEFGEDVVREAVIETAAGISAHKLDTIEERYQFLRAALGHRRVKAKRRPPTQAGKP